jgi:hypothetical protein
MAASPTERSWCILEFARCKSFVAVQRAFGFVKDNVYVSPLPKTLPELQERINTAIGNVTQDMFERVWREWEYRLDICRVTY